MSVVTVRAAAKINLRLGVGPLRDGFHALDTVYQAISLYDDVTVADAPDWSVAVRPLGGLDCTEVPTGPENLVVRAGRLLTGHHGLDRAAAITIDKGIPVAGGLAGGSADAAAALVALDRLWDLGTSDEDLLALAARLGSDIPFSLLGGTARGTGRGELVSPVVDAGSWWWVVVPNPQGLSTPAVYAEFDRLGGAGALAAEASAAVLAALRGGRWQDLAPVLENDLTSAALSLRPDLALIRSELSAAGARAVLLSGSGPTMLALAADRAEADRIRGALADFGHEDTVVATGPVAGAHLVEPEPDGPEDGAVAGA